MATIKQALSPAAFLPDDTNGADYVINQGTNYPVAGYAFDGGSVDELIHTMLRAIEYGSGNITIDIDWYADTATSGNVVWGAQIAVITPNTDTQDVETNAFATANTFQDAHLATTGQRLHRASIALSNLDSLAAEDDFWLQIYRDASDTTNDTMTGDAIITLVTLSYSDT